MPTSRPSAAMVSFSRPRSAIMSMAAARTSSRGGAFFRARAPAMAYSSDLRLLLGDAVDATATGEDRTGVHQCDRPLGEQPAEDPGRDLVARVVEAAEHHAAVAEIVVDVGVVGPVAVGLQDGRGRDLDDLDTASARVRLRSEQADDLLAELVVGVRGVGLGVRDDHIGPGEGG